MALLLRNTFIALITLLSFTSFGQKAGFNKVLNEQPNRLTTFCVPNTLENEKLLENSGISVKYSTEQWAFITTTPQWIYDHQKNGTLKEFYFELAPPSLLSDSVRLHHFVNEVHQGTGGLNSSYTGKGVIIGYVDTGIEIGHADFMNADSTTRVIRYWDQTMPDDANSPAPYGYGQVWMEADINGGNCTSVDNSGHGSTVSGQGSGNGLANGENKGMAPESIIIVVESDFSRPNWTLTVADACDYVFKVADSLEMPAVVNLSLGSYLGSHDGNDPASVAIENLLDEKPGRIVVAAAGNSGAQPAYHIHEEPDADTNFTWFVKNPSGALGANAIIFDIWADPSDATWSYSFAVDRPSPDYSEVDETIFRNASANLGSTVYDTIRNSNQDILSTIEVTTNLVNGAYNMLAIMRNCDSSDAPSPYLYRFNTTGSGKYDLWSGAFIGLNQIVTSLPAAVDYPPIANYILPDTDQSIVSSWNCSEKVISVGNVRNRTGFPNMNGTNYTPSDNTPVGQLSPNSSKGPNRHNVTKPDVTASGDVSLGAGPLWFLQNPVNNNSIAAGGVHIGNGGTSMAAPVVSGIAALYLERCNRATYQDFMDDMKAVAFSDGFTGTTPNNAYGYGKIHALNTLLEADIPSTPTLTVDINGTTVSSSNANTYVWYLDGSELNGETDQDLAITPPYGEYTVEVYNTGGCSALSDPLNVSVGISETEHNLIKTFPNPGSTSIRLDSEHEILDVYLIDASGRSIELKEISKNQYSLNNVSSGTYTLKANTTAGIYHSKVVCL